VKSFDRVVVGAGISGLLAAWRALERGEKTLVVHQGGTPGGIIQKCEIGGVTIDAGAESFSVTGDEVHRLISELNLLDDVILPNRFDARIIISADKKIKIPHGIFGIPSSLDDPELKNIISPQGLELAKFLDSKPVSNISGLTIGQLVEQRLGVEILEKLVDPIVAGVHASSAANLDAESTIPALLSELKEAHSLCQAVAKLRGSHLRPGSAVASINRGLFRLSDEIFNFLENRGVEFWLSQTAKNLTKTDSNFQIQIMEECVNSKNLTISAGIEGSIQIFKNLINLEVSELPAVDVTLAIALVESEQLNENPLGSGALVAKLDNCEAKATTHVNAKWDWVQESLPKNNHVIRLSYGKDGNIPSDSVKNHLHSDISELYGVNDHRIIESKEIIWRNSLYRSTLNSKSVFQKITEFAEEIEIELCGSFISGNGILGITQDHYKRKAS
jgi:protoporphyrinogen/coproporphyrinogen III oxidase